MGGDYLGGACLPTHEVPKANPRGSPPSMVLPICTLAQELAEDFNPHTS